MNAVEGRNGLSVRAAVEKAMDECGLYGMDEFPDYKQQETPRIGHHVSAGPGAVSRQCG